MCGLSDPDLDAIAKVSAVPILLLDRAGAVLTLGTAAATRLAAVPALAIRNGALFARRKSEDRALRDALASLSPEAPAASVCFRNRESRAVAVMDLLLLPSGKVAWQVTDLLARPAPSAARLQAVFGLTPAEARVAGGLLSGLSLGAVARLHGVEPETVRSQAKRIRAKTGARTQNQLLGMLLAAGSGLAAPV